MVTAGGRPERLTELSMQDLREVGRYAAECAQDVLDVFEAAAPADPRPRAAIDAALTFARGGPRGKGLRDTAWGAQRAAQEAIAPAVAAAARAAMSAAGAAYLHPLADPHQVKHILGAAAFAARAGELAAGDAAAATELLERARGRATAELLDVLRRYPPAPTGGGRVGELLRELDAMLRDAD